MLFPLVKWELQHTVACRKAQKHQYNRECRRCCTIANYSIHSPALAPQTISGLEEKTSQHTLGYMGELEPSFPTPGTYPQELPSVPVDGLQHRPPPCSARLQRPQLNMAAAACISGGSREPSSSGPGCPAGGRLSTAGRPPNNAPQGQRPTSPSFNLTQGFQWRKCFLY